MISDDLTIPDNIWLGHHLIILWGQGGINVFFGSFSPHTTFAIFKLKVCIMVMEKGYKNGDILRIAASAIAMVISSLPSRKIDRGANAQHPPPHPHSLLQLTSDAKCSAQPECTTKGFSFCWWQIVKWQDGWFQRTSWRVLARAVASKWHIRAISPVNTNSSKGETDFRQKNRP